MDWRDTPVTPAPNNLMEVVRGYTAADWRDAMMFLLMVAIAITSAAALILLMEPATP